MRSLALLAAASAIAMTGAVAYAQPAPTAGGPGARHSMTQADFSALTDARIAGIQAGLKLNADQQKLWAPVEQALRAQASARTERFAQFREERRNRSERPDMMQMLERRSERASQSAENLRALTTAMKPFWASLDDQQKRLLPILMRPAGHAPRRWHGRMNHRGPGPQQEQGQTAPAPRP